MDAEENYSLRDSCAVFGCVLANCSNDNSSEAADVIYCGLLALQHRGQESSGIVTYDGQLVHIKKGMGLVMNVYDSASISALTGSMGIGHNRYSTAGLSDINNCQPLVVDTIHGRIAVAHNGELVEAKPLRQRLLREGVGLSTSSDSELMTQILVREPDRSESPDWPGHIRHLMKLTRCSYSFLMLTSDGIYAARDVFGNRPLSLGSIVTFSPGSPGQRTTVGWVVGSESCAFHSTGAELVRDIFPGEIIHISHHGIKSIDCVPRLPHEVKPAFCVFEYVYFARPDTYFSGQSVYQVRMNCGKQLALEAPADADLVSTVPESATPAAFGYAQQAGLPYVEVLSKNRYMGRSFIQPSNYLRKFCIQMKFSPLTYNVAGKRIVLLDDSIVRGNTMKPIVKILRDAGAIEVHIRVASPPLRHPCFMGINIPTRGELIANRMSVDETARYFGADSLVYLSKEGLQQSVEKGMSAEDRERSGLCFACLDGRYPVSIPVPEW